MDNSKTQILYNQKFQTIIIISIIVLLFETIFTFTNQHEKINKSTTLRTIAQEKNFYIGTALDSVPLANDSKYRQVAGKEYNMVTPDFEMKFRPIHPSKNKYDFSGADKIVQFAEKNKQLIRGHTLVWSNEIPNWVTDGHFSKSEMKEILKNHIKTVVGHYKGKIYAWDVVNEAFNDDGSLRDTLWLRTIGKDYIELSFKWAHEADPKALLFYNDFGNEGINSKSNAIYKMLVDFKKKGVPINGVGFQLHTNVNNGVNLKQMKENMDRIDKLNIQVQITEFDVGLQNYYVYSTGEEKQNEIYSGVIKTCMNSKACTALVMWGFTDKYTYRNKGEKPLIFDSNFNPKKPYFTLLDALQKYNKSQF